MKWTEIAHGDVNAAQNRFWAACGDNADAVITRINTDPNYVERIVRFAMNGGFVPTSSQNEARAIMGGNFFGVEEAVKHFGVNPTEQQLVALKEIPFSQEILKAHWKTHILIAVFPISILGIRGKDERKLFYSHQDAWYNNQKFAQNAGTLGWKLVRKTPVEDSFSKNWAEQQKLLAKTEETPTAQVMVYTIIGHFLATGKRLFENVNVRTSDVDSGGDRVYVGNFDANGLRVGSIWVDHRHDLLGLASSARTE
jgi:hypothetical protein